MSTPSLYLNDDSPRARRSDALTSHAAADGTTARKTHSHLQIERALEANQPMTAQEIIQYIRVQMAEWTSESRVTTAMGELFTLGTVEHAGERQNPSGYMATAWRLVDAS